MKVDQEEKEILEAYELGNLKLYTPSKKEIAKVKAMARNTFRKN